MFPMVTIGSLKIPTFSLVFLFSIYLCLGVVMIKKWNKYWEFEVLMKISVWSIFGAALGGRVLSAFTLYLNGSHGFFYYILYGGSVFYGGLMGGVAATVLACKRYKQDFWTIADEFARIMPLGQAIGRIGCYLNGCCYGKEYYGIFSVDYLVDGREVRVVPTWFMEALFCILLFLFLQKKKFNKRVGKSSALYLTAYSFFRFFIEFLRGDDIRGYAGLLSTSQIISIVVFIVGIYLLHGGEKNNEVNVSRRI